MRSNISGGFFDKIGGSLTENGKQTKLQDGDKSKPFP